MITPNYYPNYQQYQQPQQYNNGFVVVRSEEEARNYPVAAGNSVTFRHENAPYCYVKTMGFSQFDTPRFEKYRLVKESTEPPQEDVWEEIRALKEEIERLKDGYKQHNAGGQSVETESDGNTVEPF